jgi:hypothetical protein
MKVLEAAIVTQFQAATTIGSGAVKGPFCDLVPATLPDASAMTYPFAAYSLSTGNTPKDYFDGTELRPVTVKFTIYDDDLSDVQTLQEALHTAFDWKTGTNRLSLSSGRHCGTLRMDQFAGYAGLYKSGARIYRATSVYRFQVLPA